VNFFWDNIFRKSARDQDVATVLKRNVLFCDLSERELSLVLNIIHVRRYHPGEPIFRQGEAGVGMYIVIKGRVEIYVTDPNAPREELRDIYITQLTADDFFGELSLVEENGHRTASAIAREDTSLIGFFKPDLMEILGRSPQTGVKIMFRLAEVLGHRLKETTDKVSELRKTMQELRAPPPLTANEGLDR
jgi:CRP/FNR family cyclic AMP-dependent transcriptional regulator